MSDPVEAMIEAFREARTNPSTPTRLATVTGGTQTTVFVRFDGETSPSARAYLKTFAPVGVNDRVLMLRVGTSWVAISRVPTTTQSPDTGPIACTPYPNVSLAPFGMTTNAHRRNGFTTVRVELSASAALGAASAIFLLPVGTWPIDAVRVNCGSPLAVNRNYTLTIGTNGVVTNVHAIPNTEILLGHATFPSAD